MANHHDMDIFSHFTAAELKQLAQAKRYFERLQCDSELATAVSHRSVTDGQLARLRKIGVMFELAELPSDSDNQHNMALYIFAASKNVEEKLDEVVKQFADKYPLLKIWGRYLALMYQKHFGGADGKKEPTASSNAAFDAWRKRRIAATKSELGFFGSQIDHPAFAYELSEGCSVGCWFCSFATDKLSAVFDYDTGRDEALRILGHCIDMFGKEIAGNALPYYRTEPHDNPDYIEFLQDFEKKTGEVLCTSTAVCGDIAWIRRLLAYYQREDKTYHWPRLSILSLAMMDKVHDAFTPDELLSIELLVQSKDHFRPKVTGGRILAEHDGLRDSEHFFDKRNVGMVPQGSIACVSGFDINLASRSVMLFSPCYVSAKWPYGFRVFALEKYEDAEHFPQVLNNIIERCMPLSPPGERKIKFRDDIVFRPTEEGFDLATPNQLHHFKGKQKCEPLGELINEGDHTYDQLVAHLVQRHKKNPIILRMAIQQLFNDGFLDEVDYGD